MFWTIVSLLTAPLWLATTKTKTSRTKSARKPARAAVTKGTRAKSNGKRSTAVATRKSPSPRDNASLRRPPKAKVPVEEAEETPVKPVEVAAPPPPPVAPMQAPGLFSPQPGEAAESLTPSFRWFYVGGASHYQLVWSPDTNFHRQHILLTNQTAASLPPDEALEPDTTYLWRVRGGNEGGWGPWSTTRSFRTPEK